MPINKFTPCARLHNVLICICTYAAAAEQTALDLATAAGSKLVEAFLRRVKVLIVMKDRFPIKRALF
jgi:hypothetical protein